VSEQIKRIFLRLMQSIKVANELSRVTTHC